MVLLQDSIPSFTRCLPLSFYLSLNSVVREREEEESLIPSLPLYYPWMLIRRPLPLEWKYLLSITSGIMMRVRSFISFLSALIFWFFFFRTNAMYNNIIRGGNEVKDLCASRHLTFVYYTHRGCW